MMQVDVRPGTSVCSGFLFAERFEIEIETRREEEATVVERKTHAGWAGGLTNNKQTQTDSRS